MLPFRTARTFGVPSPAANAVDLWVIALDRPSHVVSKLETVLDRSEQAHARRLWEGPLRSRYIVAQAAARHVLAQYLGVMAAAVPLDHLSGGEPCVRGASISFNLSHSGGLAVLAVSRGGRIGVDVELVRHVTDADNIVTQMFSRVEASQYRSFSPSDRVAAWFSGWTRKAAFLKATGESTERPLNSFDVDLSPTATAPWVNAGPDREWFIRSFTPAPGFTAAVAGDFPIDTLNRREWTAPVGIDVPAHTDELELTLTV
jgi:4'-phosphopantetheinyl transferase